MRIDDPADLGLWGCAIALAVALASFSVCAIAGTYAFVMWCLG